MTFEEYLNSVHNKKISIIGAGVSNLPLIECLLSRGESVTVYDMRSMEQLGADGEKLRSMGAEFCLGSDYLEKLSGDIIFRTPGLMPFDAHLQRAREQGSTVTSEMEVFFAVCPCRIIAVTGSDGKTTTTTLISELLKAAGYTVHLGGNIGHPLLCDVPKMHAEDIAVLELSSFQLHSMSCHPNVAVVTNISPNHLDKHKDYQDYIDAKMSIFLQQTECDRLVLNANDGQSNYYRSHARAQIAEFSDAKTVENGTFADETTLYRVKNGKLTRLLDKDEIRIPGEHNVQNMLTAFAAVEGFCSDEICCRIAREFAGVEHRLETVRVLHGVTYINDSIGSSPSRTIAGLHAMKRKPIVILGGYDKKIPFDELGEELCCCAKAAILTGATAEKIETAIRSAALFGESELSVERIEGFRESILRAQELAGEGDIVLLSPACAAFDRFKNFMERGKIYKEMVWELE